MSPCSVCDRKLSNTGVGLCDKHREYKRLRHDPATEASRYKKKQAGKVARGECRTCKAPREPGRSACVACLARANGRQKQFYAADPGRYKLTPEVQRAKLLRQYDLTVEQYEDMLAAQGGVCAICRKPEAAVHWQNNKVRNLAVDHDHASGVVRGLLCHRCNRVLGLLEDDVDLIQSARQYLLSAVV